MMFISYDLSDYAWIFGLGFWLGFSVLLTFLTTRGKNDSLDMNSNLDVLLSWLFIMSVIVVASGLLDVWVMVLSLLGLIVMFFMNRS